MTTPAEVVQRRRKERERLLRLARRFADEIDPALDACAIVVFGSTARGDFNVWSDIDVLVVAANLPPTVAERLRVLASSEPRIQVVAWTPAEWAVFSRRRNPIAVEAAELGVWLVGSLAELPHALG